MTDTIFDWLANLPFVTVLFIAVVLYALDTYIKRSGSIPPVVRKGFGELVESLLFAWVVVFLILKPFFMQAFYIPSESMVPTLEKLDRLLVAKVPFWYRGPERGEILVFKAPQNADQDGIQRDFIKRCIGLPGETLQVRANNVFINGTKLDEPYVAQDSNTDFGPPARPNVDNFGPIVIPAGHYFMMGDNRRNSMDSRYWGPLDRNRIVGRAWVRFWPLGKIGMMRTPPYTVPEKPQPALGIPVVMH
ncbi:MAG TPA: signal peptidase I [Armatimonadota bacterium]